MSAHSKDLDPVSVIADAENRIKTRAYQTVSGDSPLSMPGGLIMTMSKRWLQWREIVCSKPVGHHCIWYDGTMTQHQTVIQSKMTFAAGWFLEFQCHEESSNRKNNMYNRYKLNNTKSITKICTQQLPLPKGLEQESTDSLGPDLTARPRT